MADPRWIDQDGPWTEYDIEQLREERAYEASLSDRSDEGAPRLRRSTSEGRWRAAYRDLRLSVQMVRSAWLRFKGGAR